MEKESLTGIPLYIAELKEALTGSAKLGTPLEQFCVPIESFEGDAELVFEEVTQGLEQAGIVFLSVEVSDVDGESIYLVTTNFKEP